MIDVESLSPEQKQMAVTIGDNAVKAGIDPDLAIAQAFTESRLNHFVGEGKGRHVIKSGQDAYGVMQITPALAKAYGYSKEDLLNPIKNVQAYTEIMKNYLTKYGAPDLAVMAYHQGEGPVDKFLKDNNLKHIGPEGKKYLQFIGEHYDFTGGNAPVEVKTEEPTQGELLMDERRRDIEAGRGIPEEGLQGENAEAGALYGTGVGYGASRIQKALNKAAPPSAMRTPPPAPPAPAPVVAEPPMTSGEKWASKTTGSMGPAGETTTEAARNYRLQQELERAGQGAKYRPTYEGIILDTPTQAAVEAERKAKQLQEQQRLFQEQQRLAQEAERMKSPLGKVSNMFRGIRTMPAMNLLGGVGAGLNAGLAKERYDAGDPLGAAIAGINALSDTMAMIPVSPVTANPYLMGAKGLGVVGGLAGIPLEYAYQKYREAYPLPKPKPRVPVVDVKPAIIKP